MSLHAPSYSTHRAEYFLSYICLNRSICCRARSLLVQAAVAPCRNERHPLSRQATLAVETSDARCRDKRRSLSRQMTLTVPTRQATAPTQGHFQDPSDFLPFFSKMLRIHYTSRRGTGSISVSAVRVPGGSELAERQFRTFLGNFSSVIMHHRILRIVPSIFCSTFVSIGAFVAELDLFW